MTKETETLIASDEDLTRLFAGKPTQYRKSKSLPKFTGEAMRTCATINRIFFDDPDEAYRLFHELVPDAGEGVQFTPPFNVDYGIGLTIGRGTFLNKDFMVCGGGYVTLGEDCLIGPRCTIATPNHALDAATRLAGWLGTCFAGDDWRQRVVWCERYGHAWRHDWLEFHYRRGFCGYTRHSRQFDRSRQSGACNPRDSRTRSCLRRCRGHHLTLRFNALVTELNLDLHWRVAKNQKFTYSISFDSFYI